MASMSRFDARKAAQVFARSAANARTQAETVGWLDADDEAKAYVAAVHTRVSELYRAELENCLAALDEREATDGE